MELNPNKIRIVSDTSSDVMSLPDVPYQFAPMKVVTADREYVDDENLDIRQMVDNLQSYRGKSSTSCPNAEDWLRAFGDAEQVYCVTITATLSGSYNAAMTAKQIYEEQHPERKVFVLNSLTAGPEIRLIIEKIRELVLSGKIFEDICETVSRYCSKTGLLFMLESMKNLANNGRVSPLVAKMAGLLGIRVVGKASDRGDLEPLNKCRGEKKALETIVERMKELGYKAGKVHISHCFNEGAGQELKALIQREFGKVKVEIHKCMGLCSFYAEKGGMLVGFEKG
ncbi:MAG: DegV family EDD domain-containing protein [Ruminococcaceae bacterium]|nr:DegV family EDD domain-containing protein [Oscillospiraceae bacterium]